MANYEKNYLKNFLFRKLIIIERIEKFFIKQTMSTIDERTPEVLCF